MSNKEIAHRLEHYLEMYAISPDEEALGGILIYAAMLAGATK